MPPQAKSQILIQNHAAFSSGMGSDLSRSRIHRSKRVCVFEIQNCLSVILQYDMARRTLVKSYWGLATHKNVQLYLDFGGEIITSNMTAAAAAADPKVEIALSSIQPLRDLAKNWDVDIASW